MIRSISFLLSFCMLLSCNKTQKPSFHYPETRRDTTVVDNYHGTLVADPYRWLEDDRSEETAKWVEQQNALTFSYLKSLPQRDIIRKRLDRLYDHERYFTPFRKGEKLFFYKNDGMQDQNVLYVQDSIGAEARVLLDPNKLSDDGTVALGGISISKDGNYLAYQISSAGSDWNEIRIRDLNRDQDLEEVIRWVKFSGMAWKGNGFFYSRYDAPDQSKAYSGKNQFHKVFYHRLGTPQEEDELIFWNKDEPLRNYYAWTPYTEDAVVIFGSESTSGSQLYYQADGERGFRQIVSSFDHEYGLIDHDNGVLLARTNMGAPNYRLVRIDVDRPGPEHWTEVIPEQDHVLENVQMAGPTLVATYLKDVTTRISVHGMDGTLIREVPLPGLGTAQFSGSREAAEAFYSFTSFTYPTTVFRYDLHTGRSELFKKPQIDFDPEMYEVKQVFYPSKDGTRVPMFIVHRKGLKLDGANPTLLYGYGGFNISVTPNFSAGRLVFLENGGVYAQANLRGGGEYGEAWHRAGTKLQKQNVFDDFIAAAEYLIEQGYTQPQKLAISGRSNGGLLVGACMTQRPDLYKVCLPAVGVLDMLRFHQFTIGWAWTGDYGSSENEEEFNALYAYSPLHNVRDTAYPATLVTTADHDDRVVPAHSFKFISELQYRHTGELPVLIRVDVDAGHGAGKPLSKYLDEEADVWAFVFEHLGVRITD